MESSFVKHVRTDCTQLFFLFQGAKGKLMMPSLQFINETGLIDRNFVMFKDLKRQFYLSGISPEISDIPSLVEWQRKCIKSLPHVKEVYCVGTSMGAFAAIITGHLLKAKTVWAFGLPKLMVAPRRMGIDVRLPENYKKCHLSRERIIRLFRRLFSRGPYLHLCEFLNPGNGVTEYKLFYNRYFRRDALVAKTVAKCARVKLHPLDGRAHNVITHLVGNGSASQLFPAFSATSGDAD